MGQQAHNSWPDQRRARQWTLPDGSVVTPPAGRGRRGRPASTPLGLVAPGRVAGRGRQTRRERREMADATEALRDLVTAGARAVADRHDEQVERPNPRPRAARPQLEAGPRTTYTLPNVHDIDPAVIEGQQARSLPYRVGVFVTIAAVGAWGVSEASELAAGPAAHVAAAGIAGALTLAVFAAARTLREPFVAWRRHVAAAGASVMVTATALDGPSWPAAALLLAGGAALSVRHLREHEVPIADPDLVEIVRDDPTDDGQDVPVGDVGEFAARWSERVARHRGQAQDSTLHDGATFDNGLVFMLQLAGDMTLAELQGRTEKVASALGCDPMQLVLDDPPVGDGWRDASKVRLQYVTRSPITSVVEYVAPSYRGGRIGLGPYADGRDEAEYELFGKNSMWSGVVVGSTGSGKSALLNGIVASARSSGTVTTLYLDPKMNSSPEIAATATVPVLGLDLAETFTAAVEALLRGRGLESGAYGWSGFTASATRPGYLVVIDECDMLFALEGMAARWGMIAKTARALGVGLLLATQIGNITAFGGNEMLRSNVAAGNVVLMRTATGASGTLIAPGLPSPKSLPAKPGYGYLKAPDARTAPFRGSRLLSRQDALDAGTPGAYTALTALEQHPDAPLDAVGAKALAPLLAVDPAARAQETQADMARRLAEFLELPLEVTARPSPAPVSFASGGPVVVPLALGADAVVTTVPPADDAPAAPEDGEPRAELPDELTGNQAVVWRALDATVARGPSALATSTALAPTEVSRVLAALKRRGLADRRDRGAWVRIERGEHGTADATTAGDRA